MLGAPTGEQTLFDQESPYLLFRVGEEYFALESGTVREVIRWREPVPVPGTPPLLPGILVQRGTVYTAVNARLLLGNEATAAARATRYVLLQIEDQQLALLVDAVLDLVVLDRTRIELVPATLDPQRARLLGGLIRTEAALVALLDAGELLAVLQSGAM